jgi:vancomycin resistance protein YoaR
LEAAGADRAPVPDVDPVEATVEITDGEVRISGGTAGYQFDPDAVAEQVLEVAARPEDRTETLVGPQPQPELTRADAEELGIVEEVSSFTTNFDCCPPRVTNIQLMADIVDGALIRPGERFSLNDHAGPRTEERGFVAGGAILDGELEEVVGGGSSQFATTFFNAAFFSGVELVAFQPHSYYFPRYPAGRESTISYNVIDVVIENDSPYGILVESSATDTSVTVAFWSSPWAEAEAFDSGPYNVVQGAQRDGFDIDFGRVVTYPDGSTEREEWFHRYEPQD